jgi:hypothetical protein
MTNPTGLPEETTDGKARVAALACLRFDDVTPTAVVEFVSGGRCLIVGDEQRALEAARRLGPGLPCVIAVPSGVTPRSAAASQSYAARSATSGFRSPAAATVATWGPCSRRQSSASTWSSTWAARGC